MVNTADGQQLLRTIQAAEQEAHRLGFTKTGRALNDAMNSLGWEMAGKVEPKSPALKRKP